MGKFILLISNSESDRPHIRAHAKLPTNSFGPVFYKEATGKPNTDEVFSSDTARRDLLCFLDGTRGDDDNTGEVVKWVEKAQKVGFETVEVGVHDNLRTLDGVVTNLWLKEKCEVLAKYSTTDDMCKPFLEWCKSLELDQRQLPPPFTQISKMLRQKNELDLRGWVQRRLAHLYSNFWRPVWLRIEMGRETPLSSETLSGLQDFFAEERLWGFEWCLRTLRANPDYDHKRDLPDRDNIFSYAATFLVHTPGSAATVRQVAGSTNRQLQTISACEKRTIAECFWRLVALLVDSKFERYLSELGLGVSPDNEALERLRSEEQAKFTKAKKQFYEVVDAVHALSNPPKLSQVEAVRRACKSDAFDHWFLAVQESFDKLAQCLAQYSAHRP